MGSQLMGSQLAFRHPIVLPGCGGHPSPQGTVRVDLLAAPVRERQRYVREMPIPVADHHIGSPSHPGVYSVLTECQTELRIDGVRWQAANDVTGVDVLEGEVAAPRREAGLDLIAQVDADVGEPAVARGVAPGDRLVHQLLPGPFGNGDNGVMSLLEPRLERLEETTLTVERERHLGDQAEVDVAVGQGCVGGDEAAVATHQLDQANTVVGAARLGVGGSEGAGRLLDGGGEAEAALDPADVVVDRLGNTDDADAVPAQSSGEHRGAAHRAVPTDGEKDADLVAEQRLHHVVDGLRAA